MKNITKTVEQKTMGKVMEKQHNFNIVDIYLINVIDLTTKQSFSMEIKEIFISSE